MPIDPRQRRMSFDRNAIAYHEGRPPYPDRVYDLLAEEHDLRPGCQVLEIGAGSGIATCELVNRGAQVTAVEPGAALASVLRERHQHDPLTVIPGDFEHVRLPLAHFDLAVAATAWHWVDATVAVPKVASLLRPGGALAVWWTIFGDPDAPDTEFRSLLDPLYALFLPHERDDGQPPKPMRFQEWQEQLQTGGWFNPPEIEVIRWTQPLTAASAQALWATFPNIAELDTDDRTAFLAGVGEAVGNSGGLVDDPRLTIVYHTRLRPPVW